jgi:exonuclease III
MARHGEGGLTLSLMTVNVNGLAVARPGGATKAQCLLRYLEDLAGAPDVVMLQEVKCTDIREVRRMLQAGSGNGLPWKGKVWMNPGTAHSRGVAVLVRDGTLLSGFSGEPQWADGEGRVLRVDCRLMHHEISLMCVYAPATGADRPAFFQQLQQHVPAGRVVVMGGDFNCILGPGEESRQSAVRRQGGEALRTVLQTHGLVDVWASRQPHDPGYTHVATNCASSAARLDRWLVGQGGVPWVASLEIRHGAPADHEGVLLVLQPPDLPIIGSGGWAFPTYLLYHPSHKPALQEAAAAKAEVLQVVAPDPRVRWELMKAHLRLDGDQRHRQHVRQRAHELRMKQRADAAAARAYAAAPAAAHRQEARMEARVALRGSVREAARQQAEAAASLYQQQGERPTKWFHQLPRVRDGTANVITALAVPSRPEPAPLSGADAQPLISEAAKAYYCGSAPAGLFRKAPVDAAAQDILLASLTRRLPAEMREAAEGPAGDGSITPGCLAAALAASANHKAPGTDGLPYEVYRVLWDIVGPMMAAAANAALEALMGGEAPEAAMPDSWLEGIIILLYKGKGLPRPQLASYRPITLLNADAKLVAKAVATRLQGPLNHLVDPLQTAFLKGRWIGDNVLYHLGLAEYLHQSGQPAALLILDIEKAYDRVDRGWLFRVATEMGFGPGMLGWMRLMLAPSAARVAVNGHLSAPVHVWNGLPQGSPASPPLWVLQLQPLTAYLHRLRAQNLIRTPTLPNGCPAPPVAHHADDTKLLVSDVDVDGPRALDAIGVYCAASNARVHPDKAKGVVMGTHTPRWGRHQPTQADFGEPGGPAPRLLGVPFTRDMGAAAAQAYDRRVDTLQGMCKAWEPYQLTLIGRAHVAKQVLASAMAYHASFVPPTDAQARRITAIITDFVARSSLLEDATLVSYGRPALCPKVAVGWLPGPLGGCGVVDIAGHWTALQSKVVAQLLSPGTKPWQVVTRHLLGQAAPFGGRGLWWVASAMPLHHCGPALTPRLHAYLAAFRRSAPERLVPPDDTEWRALLCEPLYYNPLVVDAGGEPLQPPAERPAGWPFTGGELRAAPAALRNHPALQAVVERLPPLWQPLLAPAPGQPPPVPEEARWLLSPDGGQAVSAQGAAMEVLSDGRMVPLPLQEAAAAAQRTPVEGWSPACVLKAPKHKSLWSAAERMAYEMAQPSQKAAVRPMEDFMLGKWDGLPCFPPAHGHGKVPLHCFVVRDCRVHVTLRKAGVALGRLPVQPAAWPGAGDGPAHRSQQELEEQQWDAAVPRGGSARFAQEPPEPPLWMRAGRPPRAPPRNRGEGGAGGGPEAPPQDAGAGPSNAAAAAAPAAEAQEDEGADAGAAAAGPAAAAAVPGAMGDDDGEAAAAGGAPGPAPAAAAGLERAQAAKAAWQRLWRAPVSNIAKSLAWRLMHNRVLTGLYWSAHQQPSAQQQHRHLCHQPSCVGVALRQRPLDSLSHLVVSCPTYEPARQWLSDLWHAITGRRPPLTAAVLLGDYDPAWPDYPRPCDLVDLWSAVRITWLHAVWLTSREPNPSARHANAAVFRAVSALCEQMRVRFGWCDIGGLVFDQLPTRLGQTPAKETPLAKFRGTWAVNEVLCATQELATGAKVLILKLTMTEPVAAPAPPPPQQGEEEQQGEGPVEAVAVGGGFVGPA